MALQRYEENPNNYENFREKQEIICKFSAHPEELSVFFATEIIQIMACPIKIIQIMSAPFPRKMLPLHHKITRKRTLGNRKKTIRKIIRK